MKAILLLALLSGCAAFDGPPDSLCISGYCARLQGELKSPEIVNPMRAAGAMTVACRQRGERAA